MHTIRGLNPNLFKKSEIARMLNLDPAMLRYVLPQSLRDEINFDDSHKRRRFTDADAYKIIKHIRGLATHDQIMAMIYPRGIENGINSGLNQRIWANKEGKTIGKRDDRGN